MEDKKKISPLYRLIKWLVWLFSPKMTVEGAENIPDGPVVIVGNHTQMYGPIACELYSPIPRCTWCAGQMMHWKEVPGYAYQDFWSQKPRGVRWFYRILAYLITPLSVCVFNNAETVPVYRDSRIITTFRESIRRLQEGAGLVIFPEHDLKYNNILYAFEDKFIDVARFYYKKTKQELYFVPLYIAPRLKKMIYGKPIRFDASAPIQDERERICRQLADAITAMACAQPLHTVIPYRNIPKRLYPKNLPLEVYSHEENPG